LVNAPMRYQRKRRGRSFSMGKCSVGSFQCQNAESAVCDEMGENSKN
jgi:hypothetical protein